MGLLHRCLYPLLWCVQELSSTGTQGRVQGNTMERSVILLGVTVQGLRQPQLLAYKEGEELEFQACQCTSISSQHLQVSGIGMGVTNALHSGSKPLFAGRANQQPLRRIQERRCSLPPSSLTMKKLQCVALFPIAPDNSLCANGWCQADSGSLTVPLLPLSETPPL